MSITARYAATCTACQAPIRPGQQIEWSKGQPARHTSCASAATAPAAAPAKAATPGTCACGAALKEGYRQCYRCYSRSAGAKCRTCGGTAGTRGRYGQYTGGTCECCRPNCDCYDCRS